MTNILKALLMAAAVTVVSTSGFAEGYRNDSKAHSRSDSQTRQHVQLNNSDIRAVQESLKDEGYNLPVDGVWGQQTVDALRSFQRANNLSATGQLDSETVAELDVDVSGYDD